jgi:MYXO-CTERM domain-containing protein
MYQSSFSGQINGQVQSTTTVPLPAPVWLFGSAALALLGLTSRRRSDSTEPATDFSGEDHG